MRITCKVTSGGVQANADASLLGGAINPTTIRQGLLGFNSGRNLLQDPAVKVCTALENKFTYANGNFTVLAK